MREITISNDDSALIINISCPADFLDISMFLLPRYWLHTTAPPVARADNIWISRLLILSTSATPETAASPAIDTMNVSTKPTLTASNCSNIRGIISFFKSLDVNIIISYINT